MFTFSVPTTALFGAGKLNELHGQINTPMSAVHGKKPWWLSPMASPLAPTATWIGWRMS